jgi:hypothetical protein
VYPNCLCTCSAGLDATDAMVLPMDECDKRAIGDMSLSNISDSGSSPVSFRFGIPLWGCPMEGRGKMDGGAGRGRTCQVQCQHNLRLHTQRSRTLGS